MEKIPQSARKITPQIAIERLKAQGITLDTENATAVVDFLYLLACILHSQNDQDG
jgi:hypothetical protein